MMRTDRPIRNGDLVEVLTRDGRTVSFSGRATYASEVAVEVETSRSGTYLVDASRVRRILTRADIDADAGKPAGGREP